MCRFQIKKEALPLDTVSTSDTKSDTKQLSNSSPVAAASVSGADSLAGSVSLVDTTPAAAAADGDGRRSLKSILADVFTVSYERIRVANNGFWPLRLTDDLLSRVVTKIVPPESQFSKDRAAECAAQAQPYVSLQRHQILRGDVVKCITDSESNPPRIQLRGRNGLPHSKTVLDSDSFDELQRTGNVLACADAVLPLFTERCVAGTVLEPKTDNFARAVGSVQMYPTGFYTAWHTDSTGTVNVGVGRLQEDADSKLGLAFGQDLLAECKRHGLTAASGLKMWLVYPATASLAGVDLNQFLSIAGAAIIFVWDGVRLELPGHFMHCVVTIQSYLGYGFFHVRAEAVMRWIYDVVSGTIRSTAREDKATDEPERVCTELIDHLKYNSVRKYWAPKIAAGWGSIPATELDRFLSAVPPSHSLFVVLKLCGLRA